VLYRGGGTEARRAGFHCIAAVFAPHAHASTHTHASKTPARATPAPLLNAASPLDPGDDAAAALRAAIARGTPDSAARVALVARINAGARKYVRARASAAAARGRQRVRVSCAGRRALCHRASLPRGRASGWRGARY
jgi:hypothetical protein